MQSAYKETENLLHNESNWSVAHYEKFLSDYKSILHPNNMCMVRIKNSLVGFYGRSAGYEVPALMANPRLLERKIALAKNSFHYNFSLFIFVYYLLLVIHLQGLLEPRDLQKLLPVAESCWFDAKK